MSLYRQGQLLTPWHLQHLWGLVATRQCGCRRGWGRGAGRALWWLSPKDHFPAVSALVPASAVLLGLPLTKNRPGKENLSAGLALSQAFRWKSVWPGYPRYLILDHSFLCWQELLCQKLT